jgi:uncharacterized protein (TIGR02466 family)
MPVRALFPTMIYEHQGTSQEIFLIQDEIKKKLPLIEATDEFSNPPGWNDGVQTNIKARHNTIRDFELDHLKAYIEKHIKIYIDKTQAWHPVPVSLRHSWVNKTSNGEKQDWHQHQDALISGTYYYQTTGNDGEFGIMNPVPWMQQEVFPFGNIVEKFAEIKPAVGKIILFPGWLQHCVNENKTSSTRITISWNFHRDYFRDSRDNQNIVYV